MPEKIWERLEQVSAGLRWLGRYEEANALNLTIRLMRTHGIEDLKQWEAFVDASKA